jgi:FkbM family methyltransferase
MLIPLSQLYFPKPVRGILHIGAHECEERDAYRRVLGINDTKTVWIDALPHIVEKTRLVYPNARIINACVGDEDGKEVSFMVTNNGQSSSMLDFGTHSSEHPHVIEVARLPMVTKTVNTIFKENNLDITSYNFMNLDIQGAELLALKGATDLLPYVDYIYAEVNEKELYQGGALLPDLDAFLRSHGFVRGNTVMLHHGWGDAFYTRM